MKLLSEKSLRDTGSRRLGKHKYPRSSFKYLSYDTDPKPDILVLGDWKHPRTRNNLVAGINLNYLSSGQLEKLRKIADKVFRRDSLRSRYRYLKSVLPDVAMYYRTYDSKYIKSIERGALDSYVKAKPTSRDEKVQTTADTDKAAHVQEPEKDIDKHSDEIDREVWQMKRRLYEPEKQRRRTSPERMGISGSELAKKAKDTRYKRDRRKLKELERQLAIDRELRRQAELSRKPLEPDLEPDEPEAPEDRRRRRTGDYGPEYHLDDLGYESYIRDHKPGSKLITEAKHRNLFAVFDVLSERFIVDSVISHAEMLFDAGWDYDHTVLFEVADNELVVRSDCSDTTIKHAVECFKRGTVKNILLESRFKDPSYDPEHPEECCPHCGARQERGDDGSCNRCGKPWPEE